MLSPDKETWGYRRNLKHGSHFSGASDLARESELLTPTNLRAAEDSSSLSTEWDGSEDFRLSWGRWG